MLISGSVGWLWTTFVLCELFRLLHIYCSWESCPGVYPFFAEHGSRSDIEKNHLSPLDDHHGHSFVCGLLIPTTKFSIAFASECILQTLILSHSWSHLVNAIRTPFYSRLFCFLFLFLVIGKWGVNRKSSQAIKKSDYEEGQERVVPGYMQLEMQPMWAMHAGCSINKNNW